jgi:hypothetical protein
VGHPTDDSVDVAVLSLNDFPDDFNQMFFLTRAFATGDILKKARIEVGEEVFLTGLFSNHYGLKRNIPIVRVGNIAALPDEPIETDWGSVDAYLVEMRSIGGLSGSPVFAQTVEEDYLRKFQTDGPAYYLSTNTITVGEPLPKAEPVKLELPSGWKMLPDSRMRSYCLLGLMHGHFDLPGSSEDSVVQDSSGKSVNMGIGIVVPATKILEVLDHPKLKAERDAMAESYRRSHAATLDADASPAT